MPRLNAIASVIFLGAAIVLGNGRSTPMNAETLPPRAAEGTGVLKELLGAGPLTEVPGQELVLQRVTIEPGGGLPTRKHSGSLIVYAETGGVSYTMLVGTGRLIRAMDPDMTRTVPAPLIANSGLGYGSEHLSSGLTEGLILGRALVLSAGDALVVEDSSGVFVNDGAESVQLLIVGVAASDTAIVP